MMSYFRKIARKSRGCSTDQIAKEWLVEHGLQIGEKVDCFSWNGIDSIYPGLITIGDYVTISSNVKILAHDAGLGYLTQSTRVGIVSIGNHCFIGAGTIILPNVRIGDWSVIGAGSVVTKDVPQSAVYAGNPARYICRTDEYKEKHEQGLSTLAVSKKPWREWVNATPEEWQDLRKRLAEHHGYITQREDVLEK